MTKPIEAKRRSNICVKINRIHFIDLINKLGDMQIPADAELSVSSNDKGGVNRTVDCAEVVEVYAWWDRDLMATTVN